MMSQLELRQLERIKQNLKFVSSTMRPLAQACLVLVAALVLTQDVPIASCEAKEFDWSDLGVSLASPKSTSGGGGASSNLRILVSPQRRMTKNYEFEFTNNTQANGSGASANNGASGGGYGGSGQSEPISYVLPGSSNSYLTQSALAPNHSGASSQAAAYSALSASLASLKNRLSSRGVTLSSSLADPNSQTGSLYSSSAYGNSLPVVDGSGASQQQSGSMISASAVGSAAGGQQAQPTYLSMSGNSQQDQQSASAYTMPPNQGADTSNKTIVLAIPAKINFLTGGKQQQQQVQQQQQAQQLTVIQSAPAQMDQATRAEYGPKQQISVIHHAGQEAGLTIDQSGQQIGASPVSEQQEHHQYVLVNQAPTSSNDYHSHSVAANLSPSTVYNSASAGAGQIYASSSGAYYQPVSASSGPSYTMKYLPTYQAVQPVQPMQQQQPQQPQPAPQQQMQQQPQQPMQQQQPQPMQQQQQQQPMQQQQQQQPMQQQQQPMQQQQQPMQQLQMQQQLLQLQQQQQMQMQQQQQMQMQQQQQQQQQQQPQPMQPVQKVYPILEPMAPPQPQQIYEQPQPAGGEQLVGRYSASSAYSCLDTCNSSDPRWRKYTISKYKSCCSRSSQYDTSLEQPSLDKVSESSAKYIDDAYYNYLYKKSRARRASRKQRPTNNRYSYHGRYPAPATNDDESASMGNGDAQSMSGGDAPPSQAPTSTSSSSSSSSRSMNGGRSSSYMAEGNGGTHMSRYYKNRYQSGAPAASAYDGGDSSSSSSSDSDLMPLPPASGSSKYSQKEQSRAYRRSRMRDLDSAGPQMGGADSMGSGGQDASSDDYESGGQSSGGSPSSSSAYGGAPSSSSSSGSSYGSGEYSIDAGSRYGSGNSANADGGSRQMADELDDSTMSQRYPSGDSMSADSGDQSDAMPSKTLDSDYPGNEPDSPAGANYQDDSSPESEPTSAPITNSYKYMSPRRQRKHYGKAMASRGRAKASLAASSGGGQSKELPTATTRYYGGSSSSNSKKNSRKNRKLQEQHYSTSQQQSGNSNNNNYHNGTSSDYESAQAQAADSNGSGYNSDDSTAAYNSGENSEATSDKESAGSKYKAALSFNETAVANLSKTTMHLKEILSLLEKKAHLRANETSTNVAPSSSSSSSSLASSSSSLSSSSVTSTPAPITTTTSFYSSLFGSNAPYSGSLPTEYLTSDFSLKSPYRFESSLSSLGSSLHIPPPPPPPPSYNPLATETFSPPTPSSSIYTGQNGFGSHPPKPMSMHMNPHQHPRRRRVNKNIRYSDLMLHKAAAHGLNPMSTTSLLHAAAKNRFLNQAYYPLHPYLYRSNSPSITNSYPYKNVHKNSYSSLFNGPVSSKLASSAGLYTDESRLHGPASGYDPLSHVASSLRPSSMRMRKPFVFQPQVLPIYSRHTILTPPLDVKA